MKWNCLIVLVLILLVLLGCAPTASPATVGPMPLTTTPSREEKTSVPATSQGEVKINGWSLNLIGTGITTNSLSATIDGNNAIHVCDYSISFGLKYATNKSGTWVVTTIDDSETDWGYNGGSNDIAVDGNGKVHIVYEAGGSGTMYYVTNASGSWVKSIIPDKSSGSQVGIAVTSDGKVHIVHYGDALVVTKYGNYIDRRLKYINNISGSWSEPVIVGIGVNSGASAIALDSSGKVYVAYEGGYEEDWDQSSMSYRYNSENGVLRLAIVDASGKVVSNTPVDPPSLPAFLQEGHTGWESAIAVSKLDNSWYIAYYDEDKNVVRFASAGGLTTIGACWDANPSITLDKNNKVHVSFTDWDTGQLSYATNKSGGWTVETLLTEGHAGSFSQILVEQSGKVDVIFYYSGYHTSPYYGLSIISK